MLADYEQLVADLVRDDAGKLTLPEKDRAIAAAVERYSGDKPRTKVQDVTPEATQLLPLPAAWVADFSAIVAIEYPKGKIPPTYVEQGRYAVYDDGAAKKVQLLDAVQVAANSVRVSFTIKHQVDGGADTIPLAHREPVACFASASLCEQLAALYSGGTDATIQADSVQNDAKAAEYAKRGRDLRKRYFNELGIEDKRGAPAGVVVNLDQASTLNEDRLTHPRIFR